MRRLTPQHQPAELLDGTRSRGHLYDDHDTKHENAHAPRLHEIACSTAHGRALQHSLGPLDLGPNVSCGNTVYQAVWIHTVASTGNQRLDLCSLLARKLLGCSCSPYTKYTS